MGQEYIHQQCIIKNKIDYKFTVGSWEQDTYTSSQHSRDRSLSKFITSLFLASQGYSEILPQT